MSKKRLIMLCLTLIMCFPLTAFASATNVGVSTTPPIVHDGSIIKPDSTSTPSKKSLYANGSDYTVDGSASRSSLYTNKCFKGVTEITYSITNNSSKSLKVSLCSYTKLGNVNYGVKKVTIPANGTTSASFSNLSTSKYYFLQFAAPSDFSGTVCGN